MIKYWESRGSDNDTWYSCDTDEKEYAYILESRFILPVLK